MNRLFCAFSLFLFNFFSIGYCTPPQAQLPDNPSIENLIDNLGSKDPRTRAAADNRLRCIPEAIPYLNRARDSTDLEIKSRASKILDDATKKLAAPKMLARAKAYARAGKVELAMEQLLAVESSVHDENFWQAILDIGSIVQEKSARFYGKDFEKPTSPLRTTLADFFEKREQTELEWVNTPYEFKSEKFWFNGCVRANGVYTKLTKGIVLSSERVCFRRLDDSVVLAHDVFRVEDHVRGSLIIASDNYLDARSPMKIYDGIMICRRQIPLLHTVKNSIVISSSSIIRDVGFQCSGKSVVLENEPKPLGFIEWFDTSRFGIQVDYIHGSVEISKLDPNKEFARVGCRVGDEVRFVDEIKIDGVDRFRSAMHRAVIAEKATLTLLRGKKTIEITVTVSE